MIKTEVIENVSSFLTNLERDMIPKIVTPALEKAARSVVNQNIASIFRQQDVNGLLQKQNAKSTKEAKKRRGGIDIIRPLIDKERMLINKNLYKIVKVNDLTYEVMPPSKRNKIIGYLRDKEYRVFMLPNNIRKILKGFIEENMRKYNG